MLQQRRQLLLLLPLPPLLPLLPLPPLLPRMLPASDERNLRIKTPIGVCNARRYGQLSVVGCPDKSR
jgi:hypothetical protein